MESRCLVKKKYPKIPAKDCLDGRLWARLIGFLVWNVPVSGKKVDFSGGDLGQHLLEKFNDASRHRL